MLVGFYTPSLLGKIEQLYELELGYANVSAKIIKIQSDSTLTEKTVDHLEFLRLQSVNIEKLCSEIQNDLVILSKDFF